MKTYKEFINEIKNPKDLTRVDSIISRLNKIKDGDTVKKKYLSLMKDIRPTVMYTHLTYGDDDIMKRIEKYLDKLGL